MAKATMARADGAIAGGGGGRRPQRRRPLTTLMWLVLAVVVGVAAVQDVGVGNQFTLAMVALGGLVLLQVFNLRGPFRLFFITLAVFMTVRYFWWRTTQTLPDVDTFSFVPGFLLYLAELYGIGMYMLGVFVNINPVRREPIPLPDDESQLPTVDVMVPSYDEDEELLETTLTAAKLINYPADKLNVYLLDDGGTAQKRADNDVAKANAAQARHEALQALCARLGVGYKTRERNVHAKAGNINAALATTDGELVVILDADHVPTRDFLEKTVGQFLADRELFLVQTPHFFINADPVERNLNTFHRMPSEQEMFYGAGQLGLDYWNASFFCGSAAVLRRSLLMEVGGVNGTSITEDAETALELHARGYRSAYIAEPLIAGLSPPTFAAFVSQRTRWAQGMLQIMLLKNPLFKRGLSLPQRLCYLSSCTFWLFPLARTIFLLTPLTYLFFGMSIYNASLQEFLAYAVAHLACSLMLTNQLFGRMRWPFISELYEMTQALFLAPALISVMLKPRAPTFKVTPKAEVLDRNTLSQFATPIFVVFGLVCAGMATGVWRYHAYPLEHENLAIVLGWNTVNLIFMLAALGVVYERKQRRSEPRMPRAQTATALLADKAVPAKIEDLSINGAQVLLGRDAVVHGQLGGGSVRLQLAIPSLDGEHELNAQIRHATVQGDDVWLGVRFAPQDQAERDKLVVLCFGSSAVWSAFQASRQRRRTLIGGTIFFIGLSLYHGGAALIAGLRHRLFEAPAARVLPGRAGRRVALPLEGGK